MDFRDNSGEIRRYKASLNKLMERARADGLTERQCQEIYEKTLRGVLKDRNPHKSIKTKIIAIIIGVTIVGYCVNLLFGGKPLSLFLCKIQEFIYPGLRLLRIVSIPIIKAFPSLTEYYDESCLVQNPLFYVDNMDCWPCYNVFGVMEITDADAPFESQAMPPFIYKTGQKHIKYEDLQRLYGDNRKTFDENSPKIVVNNLKATTAAEFFDGYKPANNSYKWRLNRMLPALTIRTLFPRPGVIPRLGQSTERFVILDDPQSMSYELPEPECNYVFVTQGHGERLIELHPSTECKDQCRPVQIVLTAPHMLWYNWWYWRPVSRPTKLNSTSVTYIGSYC